MGRQVVQNPQVGGGFRSIPPDSPSGYATKYYQSQMTAFFCDIPLIQSFSIIWNNQLVSIGSSSLFEFLLVAVMSTSMDEVEITVCYHGLWKAPWNRLLVCIVNWNGVQENFCSRCWSSFKWGVELHQERKPCRLRESWNYRLDLLFLWSQSSNTKIPVSYTVWVQLPISLLPKRARVSYFLFSFKSSLLCHFV